MDFSAVVAKITPSIAKLYVVSKGEVATGSGFVFGKPEIMVTCNHVVLGADSLLYRFSDDAEGTFHNAKVVIRDTEHDLALLKLDLQRPQLVPIGEGKTIQVGMPVLFSGYPLSLETLTTHQGLLSAVTKDAVGATTYLIDGTVNAGNSGCPLMNAEGEVIGIVNAKRRERSELLTKVEAMQMGALSLHGIDLVEIYQALISNVQLGIGYAVPSSYIPEHKEMPQTSSSEPVSGEHKEEH
jgi:S1-C subfamily serine protease